MNYISKKPESKGSGGYTRLSTVAYARTRSPASNNIGISCSMRPFSPILSTLKILYTQIIKNNIICEFAFLKEHTSLKNENKPPPLQKRLLLPSNGKHLAQHSFKASSFHEYATFFCF